MGRLRFAVIMLAWGMAARGAEVGDADSAMAARIEFLRDANAKMKGRLEKIRGAISYWAEQGFTADKDGASEDEGPAASAEPAGAPGRRLNALAPELNPAVASQSCAGVPQHAWLEILSTTPPVAN